MATELDFAVLSVVTHITYISMLEPLSENSVHLPTIFHRHLV